MVAFRNEFSADEEKQMRASRAADNAGPPVHPPGWIGNKNYGEVFDAVDRAKDSGDKNPRFQMQSEPAATTSDHDKNPEYVPDSRGTSGSGWNRAI